MKVCHVIAITVIAAALAGCSTQTTSNKHHENTQHTVRHFICENGSWSFDMVLLHRDTAQLTTGAGDIAVLQRQITASGEHFAGNNYELFMKGNEGMITYTHHGKTYSHRNCIAK